MAKFSVDNDVSSVTSHYNDFVSNDFVGNDFVRADLIVPKNRNWESRFNDVQSDGDEPTPIAVRIFETENNFYLWVNQQNQLFSGAPDIDSSSAQFTITTPDLSDPSYIQIGLAAFNDPKIVAADFSGGSPSLIIVRARPCPQTPNAFAMLTQWVCEQDTFHTIVPVSHYYYYYYYYFSSRHHRRILQRPMWSAYFILVAREFREAYQ